MSNYERMINYDRLIKMEVHSIFLNEQVTNIYKTGMNITDMISKIKKKSDQKHALWFY